MNTLNQEADMGYITDIVQKIATALVMSTEFPTQINAMKADLASLHADLETTKGRNAELDALLHDTRRQRDEAEQALSQAKNDLALTTQRLNSAESHANEMTRTVEDLNSALSQAKKERDDYGMQAMSAEDRAKAAEAKLDKLREAMGIPKEVPKPQVEQPSPTSSGNPAPMPEPAPEAPKPVEPKRIYEGEPGYQQFHITDTYDGDKQKWYNTVEA